MSRFSEWATRQLAKANSDFAGGAKTNLGALVPGRRQLGIGEILAPGGSGYVRDIAPEYWFGPLQPITPVAPSSYRPRQYAYTPGANIIWQPKAESPISFEVLRALADSWDLLRIIIEQQKDRICATKLTARLKMPEDASVSKSDWEKKNALDPVVKALNNEFFATPDGFHDFHTWLRMWAEDLIVIDAVALWLERDMKGKIASIHPLAGDTINRLLTDQGITPPSPSPAYQQVVYGTPACELTVDDLIYYMRNERTNRRYGYSPVEQTLITISIGLRRQEFQLQYYTSGNVPEALCFLPGDVPADKVKEYQEFFDAMLAGDLSKRRRLTFLPGFGTNGQGHSSVQFSKEVLLKDEMDEWLARVACFCIGVSPTPFTKQANRAQAQQMQETSEEEGKAPYVASIIDVLNNLVQRKMGLKDYEIVKEDEQELDVLKQAQADNLLVGKIFKVDEVRKRRGLDPDGSDEANMLGTFTPTGFIPLKADDQLQRQKALGTDPDTTHQRTMEANAAKPAPVMGDEDGAVPAGGKPNGKVKPNGKGKPAAKSAVAAKKLAHMSQKEVY